MAKNKKNFHTGHSYFHFHHHTPHTWPFHAHMHKHKPYTYNNIRTYATHHQKVAKLSAATWRISSISCRCILVLFGLRSTSAATWRISCNTYADALNSIEFCIVRLFLCHFVRYLGICNPICVKLLQLMCAVITHNSVKKRSLYINKWLSYSQL